MQGRDFRTNPGLVSKALQCFRSSSYSLQNKVCRTRTRPAGTIRHTPISYYTRPKLTQQKKLRGRIGAEEREREREVRKERELSGDADSGYQRAVEVL